MISFIRFYFSLSVLRFRILLNMYYWKYFLYSLHWRFYKFSSLLISEFRTMRIYGTSSLKPFRLTAFVPPEADYKIFAIKFKAERVRWWIKFTKLVRSSKINIQIYFRHAANFRTHEALSSLPHFPPEADLPLADEFIYKAEAGGFEPPKPFPAYRISSAAHSTTLARFQ